MTGNAPAPVWEVTRTAEGLIVDLHQPTRIIYDESPAFIPVPEALQHRKMEVILWPLDEGPEEAKSDTSRWEAFFERFSRTVEDATPFSRDEIYADRLR
jgi:hypothetical protein